MSVLGCGSSSAVAFSGGPAYGHHLNPIRKASTYRPQHRQIVTSSSCCTLKCEEPEIKVIHVKAEIAVTDTNRAWKNSDSDESVTERGSSMSSRVGRRDQPGESWVEPKSWSVGHE